jgi:hypothetical protein
MFDNLRESASSSFYEDDINAPSAEQASKDAPAPVRRSNSRFLGMTAAQRFIISLMLMFTVCVMGALAMFILGKMSLF